jgi:hypothetical protein
MRLSERPGAGDCGGVGREIAEWAGGLFVACRFLHISDMREKGGILGVNEKGVVGGVWSAIVTRVKMKGGVLGG